MSFHIHLTPPRKPRLTSVERALPALLFWAAYLAISYLRGRRRRYRHGR